jgi:hypothetical protein
LETLSRAFGSRRSNFRAWGDQRHRLEAAQIVRVHRWLARRMLLVGCSGSDIAKTTTSGSTSGAQQCPIDLSGPAPGETDSGPLRCNAPDGASEPCPCVLPDGGPVSVCGPGGQCVLGPLLTPGGPIGGWVCSYQVGGCGELVTTLCSRSCGLVTVNQAVGLSDGVVCAGDCVQRSDPASASWICASPLSASCSSNSGDR